MYELVKIPKAANFVKKIFCSNVFLLMCNQNGVSSMKEVAKSTNKKVKKKKITKLIFSNNQNVQSSRTK